MILQSLAALYDVLLSRNILEQPGWQPEKITFALVLDEAGQLLRLDDLRTEEIKGKKKIIAPLSKPVPAREKRTVSVTANFLCDNAAYMLGVDSKGKPERALECFLACRKLHEQLLADVDTPMAAAIRNFFAHWEPAQAETHPAVAPRLDELRAGANLIFLLQGAFPTEDAEIRAAWSRRYDDAGDAPVMQCLITGRRAPVAILHPGIKSIPGAQPTGASLVSFNALAYESYGRVQDQGKNAPVSREAAFAYGAALQWLVRSPRHHLSLGDMTVVFWAEDADEAAQDWMSALFGQQENIDPETLRGTLTDLAQGRPVLWNSIPLRPANRFYVLGLSPNSARLSVRFFLRDTLEDLAAQTGKYYRETNIAHAPFERDTFSLWWLLRETVNLNSKNISPDPQLAGDMLRAYLTGGRYPETLLDRTELRIRAECGRVTYGRAAIIKAFLTRNGSNQYQEVLTVELNENTSYAPYVLGRLFAVLEGLQQRANPGINTTIRDRYFTSACATPAVVFPTLVKLSQAHLKKLDGGMKYYFEQLIAQLMGRLSAPYPTRLSLQDQGVFQLGYYHQTQKRYAKKEETENA